MCDCLSKLIEKGFIQEDAIYDEQKKEFISTGRCLIRHLGKNNSYFYLNYCPACGEKIGTLKT